jgi:sporulation protein YlmC with PRC-barrel domain
VGEVVDVVFSPENRQLVGLLIGSERPEGSLLQALRRVLGADFGLRFVPIQRVISLNRDVVMIDSEPGAAPPLPDRQHFPRLSLTRRSVVVTMQGQRLGHLADVQLDAEGRRVAGYVVERQPSSPGLVAAPAPAPSVMGQVASPSALASSSAAPSSAPSRFMIPAKFRVRFGRGLIVAGEDVSRPVMTTIPPAAPGGATKNEWPAPQWAADAAPPSPPPAESPEELAAPPDAPTEQLNPSA